MAGIPQTKIFDGVRYKYHTSISGKVQAKHVAETMRNRGWNVRIVSTAGSAYRLYAKKREHSMSKKTLPPHLKKLIDTPAKRAKVDALIKDMASEEKRKMKARGYYLKKNRWIKYKT